MRTFRFLGSAFIFGFVCKASDITTHESRYWLMLIILMIIVITLDSKLFSEKQRKKG